EAARRAPDAAATAYRVAVHLAWAGDMARAADAFRLAHAGLASATGDALDVLDASLALAGLSHALLAQDKVEDAEAAARQAWDLVAGNASDPTAAPAALARAD